MIRLILYTMMLTITVHRCTSYIGVYTPLTQSSGQWAEGRVGHGVGSPKYVKLAAARVRIRIRCAGWRRERPAVRGEVTGRVSTVAPTKHCPGTRQRMSGSPTAVTASANPPMRHAHNPQARGGESKSLTQILWSPKESKRTSKIAQKINWSAKG